MVKTLKSRESLRHKEDLSRFLVEEVKDYAILALDPDNRISAWSAGAERILGYQEAEALGLPGSIIFTPEDIECGAVKKEMSQALAEGRAEDRRWHLRRDGSRFWANGVLTARRDEAGRPTGFVKVMRDETERKNLEEERDRFFTLSMDLLCTVTLDGRFTRLNPAFERALGYAIAEMVGKPVFDFLHPDDRASTKESYRKLASGEPIRWMENRFRHRDGSYKWMAWSYFPVLRDGLAYGVGRDINALKQAEEEREQLLQSERAANRLKDEFLATLSHELRSPLVPVITYAEYLLRAPETESWPRLRRAAETIHRSALAQAQMVDDLLDLSRLQTGKFRIDRRVVPLPETVAEAVEAVRPQAAAKGLTLEVSLPPQPLAVEGDPVRLQQVVWNLLHNAVKFTPAGGSVGLTLGREGGEAELVVEDTGEGIEPEFLPHLFEMFRQADSRATRKHGGMGIGLSLVRQLVGLHGGRVEAASRGKGRGARFTVRLPLRHAEERPDRSAAKAAAEGLAGLRIMVVDDSPETAEALQMVLELEGAEVQTAMSGPEALRLAGEQNFDLLLSDISMPGMDGLEMLRELRRRPRTAKVPAIAMTGFGQAEDVERAREAGYTSHLTKPVPFDRLTGILLDLTRRPPQSAGRRQHTSPARQSSRLANEETLAAGSQGQRVRRTPKRAKSKQ